jgi:hypothetical protein
MLKRFNDWLADKMAYWFSNMACFYIVTLLTLATLYFDTPKNIQGWLMYWIGIFFQAVALPVLGYVTRKAGETQEQVINETHDAVLEELALVKEQLALVKEQLAVAKEERDIIKQLVEKTRG